MITIVAVGKVKDKRVAGLVNEYLKRCKRVSIVSVKEEKSRDVAKVKKEEGVRLLKRASGFVVALSEEGEELVSVDFASFLKKENDITFLIGGAFGLDDMVRREADMVLSLSSMTFPHEIAQLLLVEQIYRGQSINSGKKYHK